MADDPPPATTLVLVNLTGYQRGLNGVTEVGVNLKSFKVAVEPEFKDYLPGPDGTNIGFCVAPMKKTVTMDGEVGGSEGIMAATAATAFAPANSSNYWGAPATGLYFDKGEVTVDRGAWKEFNAELSAHAGIP